VLLGDPGASPAEPTRDCDAAIKGLIEAFDAATEHIRSAPRSCAITG